MDEAGCYGGGDIAGAVIGTLIGGALLAYLLFWLYKNYWKNRKGTHLVQEDPENVKQEFAFDNPAFKGENNKAAGSPLDTKWTSNKQNSMDKRKTVDDTHTGTPTPRLISLRGSDFTGLGIEICGGLKDGIFVKKVMPQGPAANIVNIGDKITSITIDLRHMVQEDASTILSYASPYNVQLELLDGKGIVPYVPPSTHSPTAGGHQSLTHPLYRSSSQEDFNTIERNARKKNFPNDDGNYPTLKMEQQQRYSPSKNLPIIFKENEKKTLAKGIVEEKHQTKSSELLASDDDKKGLKFGIRVLPPNITDKQLSNSGKSPNKVQADNENNSNKEIDVQRSSPPPISKRTKNIRSEQPMVTMETVETNNFERQVSINSSGIRRDADGIPQEIPNQMMAAAMAAREHRKSANVVLDSKKGKGKAPRPPADMDNMNESTDTAITNISMDTTDHSANTTMKSPSSMYRTANSTQLNFSDNFAHQDLNHSEIIGYENGMDDLRTPTHRRKLQGSDTESQLAAYDHESDNETTNSGTQIELNSNHITVHQTSEEESENEEQRRTASLGDLSSATNNNTNTGNRPQNGTLERAQSLEMTDGSVQNNPKVTPKKRKAPTSEVEVVEFNKEPRLMDLSNLDTLQRGRLKSAYEWGNLEDAIYDHSTQKYGGKHPDSDDEEITSKSLDQSSMVTDVMAVADHFSKEPTDEDVSKKMEKLNEERNEIISKVVDDTITNVVVVQETFKHQRENRNVDQPKAERFNITWDPTPASEVKPMVDLPKSLENSIKKFIETESRNGYHDGNKGDFATTDDGYNYRQDHITISPVHFQFKNSDTSSTIGGLGSSSITTTTLTGDSGLPIDKLHHHDDQVKIINYGTNMPDDVKVSRYPFGSLERPKPDELKKLLNQQLITDENSRMNSTSKTTIKPDSPPQTPSLPSINIDNDMEPISLTFSSNTNLGQLHRIESDLTESSQISPVFSSDGQGVNSISISSMEVNIRPDSRKSDALPGYLGMENVVTISTESSQPSSIILIDDEKLDFTLRTLDEDNKTYSIGGNKLSKDEVFIIESLSSKKVPEPLVVNNGNGLDEMKTFVTEIRVQTQNDDEKKSQLKDSRKNSNGSLTPSPTLPQKPTALNAQSPSPPESPSSEKPTTPNHDEEYIPRNSEIKFTTATYESPSNRHLGEKRHSQIDQIRSTFERNHTSEIPVPIRKTSIPSLRTSPSKIPVFNSQKSSHSLNSSTSSDSSLRTSTSSNGSIHNNNNTSLNNNRVSVTVTSIKNSSRNPSGK